MSRRRRRWVLVPVLCVLVAAVLAVGAAFSPLLDVETIEVVGAPTQQVAAVRHASGLDAGDPILTFLPGSVAERVERLPWVARARIVRDLPNVVRIEVRPRVAVGWVSADDGRALVDESGRVLERVDVPPVGVPELVGLRRVGPVGGLATPAMLPAAAGALGAEMRRRLASVSLTDGALTAQIAFGPVLRFGTPDRVATKARVAAAVLATLGGAPVSYVDVGVPAAPVSG